MQIKNNRKPFEQATVTKILPEIQNNNTLHKILDDRKIPKEWARSNIVLIYKKDNPDDLNNY